MTLDDLKREANKSKTEIRQERIEKFFLSKEWKNYNNVQEWPINKDIVWLRKYDPKGFDKFLYEHNTVTYFEYKSSNATPPIQPKENHFWCRHCKEEKRYDEARGVSKDGNPKTVCIPCAQEYRRETYKELERQRMKDKYHSNKVHRIGCVIKTHITHILKGKFNKIKDKSWEDVVGLTKKEFFKYIESKLEDGWDMSNYGKEWVIQHIVPRDFAEVAEDAYLLNYYKNLIPWGYSDNAALSNGIEPSQLNEWHYTNERIQYLLKDKL